MYIIFNCVPHKYCAFVVTAIKLTTRNCKGTRVPLPLTKFPKLTIPEGMRKVWMLRHDSRPENFCGDAPWPRNFRFWQTARNRPSHRSSRPLITTPSINRSQHEAGVAGKEIVFNQVRERENWKAFKKWSMSRLESRRW